MKITIYLKPDGDGFEIYNDTPEPIVASAIVGELGKTRRLMTLAEASAAHPVLAQIIQANSPETVVKVLKALNEIAKQDKTVVTSYFFNQGQQVNRYDNYILEGVNGESVQFSVLHKHAAYIGHNDIKGAAHRESLSAMIKFAENKPEVDKYFKRR